MKPIFKIGQERLSSEQISVRIAVGSRTVDGQARRMPFDVLEWIKNNQGGYYFSEQNKWSRK